MSKKHRHVKSAAKSATAAYLRLVSAKVKANRLHRIAQLAEAETSLRDSLMPVRTALQK